MKKIVKDYLANPANTQFQEKFFENDKALSHFTKYRKEYPATLPKEFYSFVLAHIDELNIHDFLVSEYEKNPTRINALFVAYWYTSGTHYGILLFRDYDKLGILNKFLKTVMPSQLPPLPTPDREQKDDFWKTPRIDVFLHWEYNRQYLNDFFRKSIKNELQK